MHSSALCGQEMYVIMYYVIMYYVIMYYVITYTRIGISTLKLPVGR